MCAGEAFEPWPYSMQKSHPSNYTLFSGKYSFGPIEGVPPPPPPGISRPLMGSFSASLYEAIQANPPYRAPLARDALLALKLSSCLYEKAGWPACWDFGSSNQDLGYRASLPFLINTTPKTRHKPSQAGKRASSTHVNSPLSTTTTTTCNVNMSWHIVCASITLNYLKILVNVLSFRLNLSFKWVSSQIVCSCML